MPQQQTPPFLHDVAAHVLAHHDPRDVTVVLPSQRAARKFHAIYAALRGGEAGWLPRTDTLNGLLRKATGLKPLSSMEAIARLYLAHKALPWEGEGGGFASFLQWGRLALQDFNELDQYLCPVDQVLTNLCDIKDLEHWNLQRDELSQAQKRYLAQYMRLNPLYHAFHAAMAADGVGNGGAIARRAAETGQIDGFGHVVLAGMSALTPAEMTYLKRLQKADRLTVFADADVAYVQPGWEAGEFIAEQQAHLPLKPLSNRLSSNQPRLKFVGCSTQVFEAQYVRATLHERIGQGERLDDTAVVLPDGKTLSLLMQSLDLGEGRVNVTMGLAWSEGPVADFFEGVLRMVMREGTSWRHDEVRALLSHPVAKVLGGSSLPKDAARFLAELARKHWVWVGREEVGELRDGPVKSLLSRLAALRLREPGAFLAALETWCGEVQRELDEREAQADPWIRASWRAVVDAVGVCARFQAKHGVFEALRDVRDLVFQVLNQERIDLRGEPEKGLQVMGIIETRALDFKRVIVLDCNEGTLPKTSRSDSFIPFDLRASLGLPSRHRREAIYAHYLYRLLNRAEEVVLVYRKDDEENEPSRYLKQLEQAFQPGGQPLEIQHEILESALPEQRPEIPELRWTTFAEKRAREWAEHGMSPSALNTLIQCPRNFYYQYLLRMREPEAVEEAMTSSQFGSIVHQVFEKGLEQAKDRPVTIEDLRAVTEAMHGLLDEAVADHYNPQLMAVGENRIWRQLAEETVQALVDQEVSELKKGAQRTLRGLEISLRAEFDLPAPVGKVTLYGKADRVDVEGGHPVMIDYKTGKVEAKELELKGAEAWMDQIQQGKHPKALQLLVYAVIALRGLDAHGIPTPTPIPDHPGVRAGIRSGRRARSGLMHLKWDGMDTLTPEHAQAFLGWLAQHLETLYTGEVALQHNADAQYCPYCVVLDSKSNYF